MLSYLSDIFDSIKSFFGFGNKYLSKDDVTLKLDNVLVDFFKENTKELSQESQKMLDEYEKFKMIDSIYFELLYSDLNIYVLRKESYDYPIGIMAIFLHMMSPEDHTIKTSMYTIRCWPPIISYSLLKYAHVVYAGKEVYDSIKSFAIQCWNLFYPKQNYEFLFKYENMYVYFANNQDQYIIIN